MIRLQRVGRKNVATFRVVLTESQNSTKSGKYLEVLGFYDPINKKSELETEKIKSWIGKGAQLSDTMRNFLISKKIITGKKINVLPVKSKTQKRKEIKANAGKKAPAPAPTPVTSAPANPA